MLPEFHCADEVLFWLRDSAHEYIDRCSVNIGLGVLRVESYGLLIVMDGPLILVLAAVGKAAVVKGDGMLSV